MFEHVMLGENLMIALAGGVAVSSYAKTVLVRSIDDPIKMGLATAGSGIIWLCAIDTLIELVRVLTR